MPSRRENAFRLLAAAATLFPLAAGCMTAYRNSIGADQQHIYAKIFLSDFNTSWQSVLEALKSDPLDVSNREGGFVETKWVDNTTEKNFTDSIGSTPSYLKAQYRFKITIARGEAYHGVPSTKVSVQKEQLIQVDVLEGWLPIETNAIEENTLLYRIGRLIWIKGKLAQLEEQKTQQQIQQSEHNF